MVAIGSRAGVNRLAPGVGFASPTRHAMGNDLPAQTGAWDADPAIGIQELFRPAPGSQYPGYYVGGQLGANDGQWGADPRAPKISPAPKSSDQPAWGEGDIYNPPGQGGSPPVVYGGRGSERIRGVDNGFASRLGTYGAPTSYGRQSYWRGGIQGFNDKLTVKDRHAYWDAGHQRQGTDFTPASSPPNTYNNPLQEPPRPDLRTVNRTVSYQKGTDTTRNQDDLSRPYTWLGEQGSGWTPIPGGTPGLYQPYGTRGGVPYPIVDPTGGQGGRETVWAGPPHGLHSETYPDGADTLSMYGARPQMRPVRFDRPSNSPQAGQSYSQTVQHQGAPPRGAVGFTGPRMPVSKMGRGWGGRQI